MKKVEVVMFSPDVDVKGGIPFVVQGYFKGNIEQKMDLCFIPTHKDGNALKKVGVFIKALGRCLPLLPKMRSKVVHFHTSQDGSFVRKFILFTIVKVFGGKTVVHIHGSRFESFMEKNGLIRSLTKFYFDNADMIVVTFSAWKERLSKFSRNNNITILYNPVSVAHREPNQRGSLTILFLGRLGQRKGTYDLLECISKEKAYFRKKQVKFILAGDGDVEKVRELIAQEQITDLVEVPGWILSQQKEQYLKTSDILILPSYNEQMPVSILEAMGYGYPILATNVAGIPEMVITGENGYLFKPGDIQSMFFSMQRLCEDKNLREQMGRRSQELVKEKFENNKIVDQLVTIYEKLQNNHSKMLCFYICCCFYFCFPY